MSFPSCDMGRWLVLLLCGLAQVWGSSEGERSRGAGYPPERRGWAEGVLLWESGDRPLWGRGGRRHTREAAAARSELAHPSLSRAHLLFLPLFSLCCLYSGPLATRPRCPPEPHGNVPFRCLQISSFANSTWSRTDGLAWLGELQTHSWSNGSDSVRFLKPWSRGRFSDRQWGQLQHMLGVYRSSFTRDIQEFAVMLRRSCELRDGTWAGIQRL